MPTYKQLLKLIRQGKSPAEILDELPMPPCRLRRMLAGKYMKAWLKMEEDLAAAIVCHKIATGTFDVNKRLAQLMRTTGDETARKVCIALLSEGLQADELAKKEQTPQPKPPWMRMDQALVSATPEGASATKKPADNKNHEKTETPEKASPKSVTPCSSGC